MNKYRVKRLESVPAADNYELVLQDGDTELQAARPHPHERSPRIGARVVHLHITRPLHHAKRRCYVKKITCLQFLN